MRDRIIVHPDAFRRAEGAVAVQPDDYAKPSQHWPPRRNWGSYVGILAGFAIVFLFGIAVGAWPPPTEKECQAAWGMGP